MNTKSVVAGLFCVMIMVAVHLTAAPGVPSYAANEQRVEANVTNGQAIVLSAPLMILKGVGQASGFTNTITIVGPHYVDGPILIVSANGSTNLIKIADASTTVSLGADVLLGATDTLLLRPVSTGQVVKVSTSDN